MRLSNSNRPEKQQGMALIVSLILLLVLTIIGLAGMDVTTLEERMAGNMKDRNIAFQGAEAALLEGEAYLASVVVLPAFDGSNGLYEPATDGTVRWDTVDWSDSNEVVEVSSTSFNDLSTKPAYIIEDLAAAGSEDSLELGSAADTSRFYRVTARSTGLTTSTVVILQSVYKR